VVNSERGLIASVLLAFFYGQHQANWEMAMKSQDNNFNLETRSAHDWAHPGDLSSTAGSLRHHLGWQQLLHRLQNPMVLVRKGVVFNDQ
jgi:hypothetical protein